MFRILFPFILQLQLLILLIHLLRQNAESSVNSRVEVKRITTINNVSSTSAWVCCHAAWLTVKRNRLHYSIKITWSWGEARLGGAGKACWGTLQDLMGKTTAAWQHSSVWSQNTVQTPAERYWKGKTRLQRHACVHTYTHTRTNLSPGWWSLCHCSQLPAAVSRPWSYWHTRSHTLETHQYTNTLAMS